MSGHHTLIGSSRPRQALRDLVYQPTPKMWALAYPPASRIKAVCPDCGTAIEHGGVWFDAGTDAAHACEPVGADG